MAPAPLRAVLDANVLFPFTVRDTLLRSAALGLYQVYWSQEILLEATRNLVGTGRMNRAQAAHLLAAMRDAFPEALIRGHEELIASMPNDEKDRHVAAVAVKAGAQVVVTSNLRDFRRMPGGVEAQSPDDFLLGLLDSAPMEMTELLRHQAAALKRPPVTLHHLLIGLGRTAPRFEAAVRKLIEAEDGEPR